MSPQDGQLDETVALEDPQPLWQPTQQRISDTQLFAFAKFLEERGHGPFPKFEQLHWFSVENAEEFWSAVWDFCSIIGDKGERIIDTQRDIYETRFFPDAQLNVAENILKPKNDPETLLMIEANESGVAKTLTRGELLERVAVMQRLLISQGVTKGDAVGIWLPNAPLAYVVMLAAVGLGATVISTSPDFGADGVIDRFGQVSPKVVFAANGYYYAGREFDCLKRLAVIREGLGENTTFFVQDVLGNGHSGLDSSKHGVAVEPTLDLIIEQIEESQGSLDDLEATFIRLPFDHPIYILFSSGTTGKPKPIVHRAGGVLLMHLKEHRLACDIGEGDRVFFFTTTGWMMWNWLVSVMANEAAIVVYDGNPGYPKITRLFDLVDDLGVTFFGTSAKFIEALLKSEQPIKERHRLDSLRSIASTGSPLSPEGFRFVYEGIKEDLHLLSISGGTDLCGCLVGGDPTGPVYSGQIQRPMLGLAIDVFDELGRSTRPGERGELVCAQPFPSMPLTFLGQGGRQRYLDAYFDRFDNVWHQGDFAEWTPQGGIIIHGRSDATLNPGGVRIGTAEIYAQVEKISEVYESLVVGQQYDSDTRIVLFVRMADGYELSDEIKKRIKSEIRFGATPRHVPAVIVAVEDLPRTRSGKIAEIAVRETIHGREIKNQGALANPETLEYFRNIAELNN